MSAKQMSVPAFGLAWCVLVVGASVAPAADQADPQFEARWRAAYTQYRNSFVRWDDQTFCCPPYDPRLQNSNLANPREWAKESTIKLEFEGAQRSWIKPETLVPPADEVDAHCKLIPSFGAAHYGFIQSATVEAIIPNKGFVIRDVALVDAKSLDQQYERDDKAFEKWLDDLNNQMWRENFNRFDSGRGGFVRGPGLEGYVTKRREAMTQRYQWRKHAAALQESIKGQAIFVRGPFDPSIKVDRPWMGARTQIVMLGKVDDPREPGKQILAAMQADHFRRGVTSDELIAILAAAKVSREDFVAMVEAANKADKDAAKQRVLGALGYAWPQAVEPAPLEQPQDNPLQRWLDRQQNRPMPFDRGGGGGRGGRRGG